MLAWISLLLLGSLSCSAAAAYDEALAMRYAMLAGAAYCPTERLQSWSCGEKCFPGVHSVQVCHGASIKAFVGKWSRSCFASFGGAAGPGGETTILDTLPGWLYGHLVHAGFLNEWNNLQECIKQSLNETGCGREEGLSLTGHDIGAAVSTLGMYDLAKQGWNIMEAYNFGSFRTAKTAFAEDFDELFRDKFFRVTHGKDPAVDFPTGPFYLHVEPEVFYKGGVFDGFAVCNDPESPDRPAGCASQHFPSSWKAPLEPSLMEWHHNYLGIDTSTAGCASSRSLACDADIAGDWCTFLHVPCSADMHGPDVRCHYPTWWSLMGRCQCNEGYCQVNGRCEPKEGAFPEGLAAAELGSSRRSGDVLAAAALALLSCSAVLVLASNIFVAGRAARAQQRGSMPDLHQHLISEE